jgi:hypothetical protein
VTLQPLYLDVALSYVVCAASSYLVDGRFQAQHLCTQLAR